MRKLIFIIILFLIHSLTISGIFAADLYSECLDGDCENGIGTMMWEDGTQYTGEWENGQQSGLGTMRWENGDEYTGSWENDLMNGEGTYHWDNGDEYAGEWEHGEQNGLGTMTWGDGTFYAGEWQYGEYYKEDTYATLYDDEVEGVLSGVDDEAYENEDDGEWNEDLIDEEGTYIAAYDENE